MNLSGRPPYQKSKRPPPDEAYLNKVRARPCVSCGSPPPNEAHHCKDMPDFDERGLYQHMPGMGERSGDHDAIPLCFDCHRMFHLNRTEFHARNGKDYGHIGPTRAAIKDGEIDF